MPEDQTDWPIVNGQYDDDDESHLPIFDEGFYYETDWYEDDGE